VVAKKSSTKKPNIALCAGFILLCLTLFSMHFTSGLYARYISRDSAEDSARVAKFDVNVTGSAEDLEITAEPSSSNKYVITVLNKSEVAVHYELSLEFAPGSKKEGVSCLFTPSEGNLDVNGSETSELVFTVDWDKFTEQTTATNTAVAVELEFTIHVNTVQID